MRENMDYLHRDTIYICKKTALEGMETNTWINVLKWVRGAGISLLRGRRIP
jgi:hypothetical protein